ncbi:flgA [Wigglesworthia glossinidia endosymbiont of Glossina brevipalpis]|uniref:Flagella basal body P-ring formation protein FlgA n=1 Tax=Wigglesworthia glossinidia brevipalpis TaxID=36870 RepID=Q8D3G4_WIGBR|nr:flgA [Wigglesworthia glossinidia endosymbiont of Glossina brevipalpis]
MIKKIKKLFLIIQLNLLISFCAISEDLNSFVSKIEKFLNIQHENIIFYKVNLIFPKNLDKLCSNPKFILTNYTKFYGILNIKAECNGKEHLLKIFVKSYTEYYVASKLIRSGTIISEKDIKIVYGNTKNIPQNIILSNQKISGKISTISIGIGQPITTSMLKSPWIIRQGDKVPVIFVGNGFTIKCFGISIRNYTIEDIVKVKLPSGKIFQGVLNKNEALVFYIK